MIISINMEEISESICAGASLVVSISFTIIALLKHYKKMFQKAKAPKTAKFIKK